MKNKIDKPVGVDPETASIDEIAKFITKVVDREMADKKDWFGQWIKPKKNGKAGT
jgi:hypothetical protein